MREVDQALARAYTQRVTSDRTAVPPAPHLSSRAPEPAAPLIDGMPTASDIEANAHVDSPQLQWPATIRTLERQFGDRFSRLADALIEARDLQHLKVLLFTSCHRAEGRTTLVLT
ncbi:CpsD/CapB family tyrosine-protein kinase, partial [Singulisphaera rosea]